MIRVSRAIEERNACVVGDRKNVRRQHSCATCSICGSDPLSHSVGVLRQSTARHLCLEILLSRVQHVAFPTGSSSRLSRGKRCIQDAPVNAPIGIFSLWPFDIWPPRAREVSGRYHRLVFHPISCPVSLQPRFSSQQPWKGMQHPILLLHWCDLVICCGKISTNEKLDRRQRRPKRMADSCPLKTAKMETLTSTNPCSVIYQRNLTSVDRPLRTMTSPVPVKMMLGTCHSTMKMLRAQNQVGVLILPPPLVRVLWHALCLDDLFSLGESTTKAKQQGLKLREYLNKTLMNSEDMEIVVPKNFNHLATTTFDAICKDMGLHWSVQLLLLGNVLTIRLVCDSGESMAPKDRRYT